MRYRGSLAFFLAVIPCLVAWVQPANPPRADIRVDSTLVLVPVTVTDARKRYVLGEWSKNSARQLGPVLRMMGVAIEPLAGWIGYVYGVPCEVMPSGDGEEIKVKSTIIPKYPCGERYYHVGFCPKCFVLNIKAKIH